MNSAVKKVTRNSLTESVMAPMSRRLSSDSGRWKAHTSDTNKRACSIGQITIKDVHDDDDDDDDDADDDNDEVPH